MSAGYRDYAHAAHDILNKFGWQNVALVFDDTFLHEAVYFQVISQESKHTVNLVQLSELDENDDPKVQVSKAMEAIDQLEADVILVYTKKENIELMLQQKSCLHKYVYRWIIREQVPLYINCHGSNVVLALAFRYIPGSAPAELENAIYNTNSTDKDLLPLAYDAVQVISHAVNIEPCISINRTTDGLKDSSARIFACIKKVNLDGLTGPIQFNENGKRKEIELEILNLRNNSFKKIGIWSSSKRAILFENILLNIGKPVTEESLEGRKLRVVVTETAPFVIKKTQQKDGTALYEGYCIDLLDELARNLKFTYEIYPSPDGLYGAETENGTWNGMIGELLCKRADIAVAALTVTERREKVVDFSVPYMHYTEEMLLKKTSSIGTIDLLQFLNPFENYVWFATLASLVVISVAVFLINYFSPYGYKDDNGQGTSKEFSFFNSAWFALASLLQQGGDNTPRNLSGRILAGCYWFCILIWISTYTANLAAFFTVKNAENPINNLEDIVKSTYQVGVIGSSSVYEDFKTSQYETHKKIWHRIEESNTIVESTSEGSQLVRERDKFVFIDDGPILRHEASQPPCDLTVVSGLSTAKGLSFAFQDDDPHTNDFTLAILRLHENNFLEHLKRKWWEAKHECPQEQETTLSRKRIDLKSMLGVYVVLSVGILVALLALIVEVCWKRKEKKLINISEGGSGR
ncbi:glutamate receptor 2-like [Oculina patagonica]